MDEKIEERLSGKLCIENIDKWKGYPSYRAEPRVDWLLALAIPVLIEREFDSKCRLILPEFPLRKGTLDDSVKDGEKNRSLKVDFYCLLGDGNHILIELKTDSNSVTRKQLKYLEKATSIDVYSIFKGLVLLRNRTKGNYIEKYERYIGALEQNGIYNSQSEVTVNKNKKFKVVYIAPEVRGFNKINELGHGKIKTFNLNELTDILKESKDEFIRGMASVISGW